MPTHVTILGAGHIGFAIALLLKQAGGYRLTVADRDPSRLAEAARGQDVILHYAGQVTVTTSVHNPRGDFEDNALGTFNMLEAARKSGRNPIVLFASTNKVYGDLADLAVELARAVGADRVRAEVVLESWNVPAEALALASEKVQRQLAGAALVVVGVAPDQISMAAIYEAGGPPGQPLRLR